MSNCFSPAHVAQWEGLSAEQLNEVFREGSSTLRQTAGTERQAPPQSNTAPPVKSAQLWASAAAAVAPRTKDPLDLARIASHAATAILPSDLMAEQAELARDLLSWVLHRDEAERPAGTRLGRKRESTLAGGV